MNKTCRTQVVARYPGVAFGSYPYFNHPDADFLTIITVESPDAEVAKSALQAVVDGITPQGAVLRITHGE